MKQGQRFSDETVRVIKKGLLAGAHPRAIARAYKVNLNTIVRIRDGDTYAGVSVEGEEALRPTIRYEESEVFQREAIMPMRPSAEGTVYLTGEEMVKKIEEPEADPYAGLSPEMIEMAKRFGG